MKLRLQADIFFALVLALSLVVLIASFSAHAAGEDEDEGPSPAHSLSVDKTRHHDYVGGRDEGDLTVQSSLPQPVRSPDAAPGAPGGAEPEGSHD